MLALPPFLRYLGDHATSAVGLLIIVIGATLPHGVQPFPLSNAASSSLSFANSPSASATATARARTTSTRSSTTSLSNMLRDYASYDDYGGGGGGDYRSTDWRRNQGYNLNRPTPPELGGTPQYYGYGQQRRDLETNPYYDPGWAQSVRRDDTSSKSSSNYYNSFTGIETYPGFTNPRNTDKVYTNPTNPYYNPIWSQSVGLRSDEPIREGDHTSYYAPGYDMQNRNYYMNMNYNYYNNGGGGGYYNEYDGYGGGRYSGGRMMRGGGGMYMSSDNEVTGGGRMLLKRILASKVIVNNGNSLMW